MNTTPLITPSFKGWRAVVGDDPKLKSWKGERGFFPHVALASNYGIERPNKIIINAGGWPMAVHDDNARLIGAAPDMLVELANAYRTITAASKAAHVAGESRRRMALDNAAARILRVVAHARGMTTEEAGKSIRAHHRKP
jgi:hypothetical protein